MSCIKQGDTVDIRPIQDGGTSCIGDGRDYISIVNSHLSLFGQHVDTRVH